MTEFRRNRIPTSCIPDWDWAEQYQCEPLVEAEVGGRYRIHYRHTQRHYVRPVSKSVTVLAVFDELVVVRFDEPTEDAAGILRWEAAVERRSGFVALRPEVTATADADAPVEQLSAPDL